MQKKDEQIRNVSTREVTAKKNRHERILYDRQKKKTKKNIKMTQILPKGRSPQIGTVISGGCHNNVTSF